MSTGHLKSDAPDVDFFQAVMRTTEFHHLSNSTLSLAKCILEHGDPLASLYNDIFSVVIVTSPITIAVQSSDTIAVCQQISRHLKCPVYNVEGSHRITVGQILLSLSEIGHILCDAGVSLALVTMIGTRQPWQAFCEGIEKVSHGLPVALDIGMSYSLGDESDRFSCFQVRTRGAEATGDVTGEAQERSIVDSERHARFSPILSWEKFPLWGPLGEFKHGGFKFHTVCPSMCRYHLLVESECIFWVVAGPSAHQVCQVVLSHSALDEGTAKHVL